jgi:hypothetical protein
MAFQVLGIRVPVSSCCQPGDDHNLKPRGGTACKVLERFVAFAALQVAMVPIWVTASGHQQMPWGAEGGVLLRMSTLHLPLEGQRHTLMHG